MKPRERDKDLRDERDAQPGVAHQQQNNRQARGERAQSPSEPGGDGGEENQQGHFQRQRNAVNELAGDDGVGHVPMFADEKRVLFQRCGAFIGQVVALLPE